MVKFLPLTLLIAACSFFGIIWIMTAVDPSGANLLLFALFVILLFFFVFNFLGLVLYFVRTRFRKRYSASWYFKTSFKMSFFIALFVGLAAVLAILQMVNPLNVMMAILVVSLFATWSFLGKVRE